MVGMESILIIRFAVDFDIPCCLLIYLAEM